MRLQRLFFTVVLCFCLQHTEGQPIAAENGLPYLVNYPPSVYDAFSQNWTVRQHPNGMVYFGNGDGVLEFDGDQWRIIPVANRTVVRSMDIDQEGTIFAGANRELGYLKPDSLGQLTYISLLDKLLPEDRNFQLIASTVATPEGVYFLSPDRIFLYQNDSMRVWRGQYFYKCTYIGNRLFIIHRQKGILTPDGDSLKVVLGPDLLPAIDICHVFPYKKDKLLIGMKDSPWYIFDGQSVSPFEAVFPGMMNGHLIVNTEILPDTSYALAIYGKGLIVGGRDGLVKHIVNKQSGLITDMVLGVCQDSQHGLWLGLDNGVARVEVLSHLSNFDERNGLEGPVNDLIRHEGSIYAATGLGVFKLNPQKSGEISARFERLSEQTIQTFKLLSLGEDMLIASGSGLFLLRNDKLQRLANFQCGHLYQSPYFPERVYVGMARGIGVVEKEGNTWTVKGKIEGHDYDTRIIYETAPNQLWASLHAGEIIRMDLTYEGKDIPSAKIRRFNSENGLPKGYITPTMIRGKLWFRRNSTMYSFDSSTQKFVRDSTHIAPLLNIPANQLSIDFEDEQGNIWFLKKIDEDNWQRMLGLLQPDSSYKLTSIHSQRITQDVDWRLLPEGDDVLWYGGTDGVVRVILLDKEPGDIPFRAFVRRISLQGDSILFAGIDEGLAQMPEITFSRNAMRFEFAAPTFDGIETNKYQFYLEGFDEDWSAWTDESRRDYTNLPAGNYRFRVRAQNIYNRISEEDTFSFVILPPWYQSWWAFILYILSGILLIWLIVRWRLRKLEADKAALEILVQERTAEVATQNKQLEAQTQQLKELDLLKSRFFANISHEFRTPLTLILGPLEDRLTTHKKYPLKEEDQLIQQQANRLLRLVNQLLDLSKLESGSMEIIPLKGDLIAFIRESAAAFDSLAKQKKINFNIELPVKNYEAWYDQDKLEKMLFNLISNAFNFTPEGGKITIGFSLQKEPYQYEICVHNTGSFIPKEQRQQIFDRFYQLKNDTHQGTGIGLALVRELAHLHKGEIFVESDEKTGTWFRLKMQALIPDSAGAAGESEVQPTPGTWAPITETSTTKPIQPKGELPEILIVEDNADVRKYLRKLIKADYKIREASNGVEGFKKAIKFIPDLIISDLMMPIMDGVELCKKLKTDEKTGHIPVILLTAKASVESRIEGLETGADDYLTKPFNRKELQVRVANLINQREQLRKRYSRAISLYPQQTKIESADERFLKRAIGLIEKNMSDADFNVQTLRKELGMSKTQLHRKFTALTDQAPGEFIRTYRLRKAAQLLAAKQENVSQIAFAVGFNNLSYFARCFREQFGMPPSSYGNVSKPDN